MEGHHLVLVACLLAAVGLWAAVAAAALVGRVGHDLRRARSRVLPTSPRRRRVLRRRATAHRSDRGRFRRVAALGALARAGDPQAPALLGEALRSGDPELVAGAIRVLGEVGTPWSVELLVEALRTGPIERSRVAVQLERLLPAVGARLEPLLADGSAPVRFWAATLLGRCPGVALPALLACTYDFDANVRAAAVEALGERREAAALATVRARLDDPEWFVRVHALRALAAVGSVEDATLVARSLADTRWWVRTAAKDALRSFGPAVAGALVPVLGSRDAFARNGAAEVLQNVGFLAALGTTGSDGELRERILAAGGAEVRAAVEPGAHDPVVTAESA